MTEQTDQPAEEQSEAADRAQEAAAPTQADVETDDTGAPINPGLADAERIEVGEDADQGDQPA